MMQQLFAKHIPFVSLLILILYPNNLFKDWNNTLV